MPGGWTPRLDLLENGGRCRLSLGGWAHGDGDTLQEAADALVARLLSLAMRVRGGGLCIPSSLGRPAARELAFVWELGDIAARGGDIRERVFGAGATGP